VSVCVRVCIRVDMKHSATNVRQNLSLAINCSIFCRPMVVIFSGKPECLILRVLKRCMVGVTHQAQRRLEIQEMGDGGG